MSWPWNIKYPNVNNEIQNLDWTLDEVKEFGKRLDGIAEGILAEANKYTDEQLANYQTQIEEIRAEFTRLVDEVENDFDNLKIQINQSLLQMELKLIDLQQQLAADINAVNARTDLAIEQNNEYLLSHMAEELSKIKVLNYFTGEYISIQDNAGDLNEQYAKASEMGEFPLVRKWFLNTFKNFDMDAAKEAVEQAIFAEIASAAVKKVVAMPEQKIA